MQPLAGLSATEKRELLKKLLLERRTTEQSEYPLSYGQQALWFLNRLAPDMASYNVAITAAAKPSLDLGALERALNRVIERHPALRSLVSDGPSGPVHKAAQSSKVPLSVFRRDNINRDEVQADYARPFDLTSDLPLRASVHRSPQYDVLLLVAHHIAFDAWSAQLLFDELAAAYSSAEPALPPIAGSYAQFVDWQRQMADSSEGEALLAYWSCQLAGDLPVLKVGTPRTAAPTYTGGSIPIEIDAEVLAALRQIGRKYNATLFMVVLLAWAVLLHRVSECDDIIIGTPVSGRSRPEWTGVIGYFVNLLPMRVRVDSARSFIDHLPTVVETVHQGLAHQDLPFPVMVDRLKIRRSSLTSPVFQTMVNVQRVQARSSLARLFGSEASGAVAFGANALEPYPIRQQEGQFDIMLELAESTATAVGHVKFSTDVLSRAEAEDISAQFSALLRSIAATPGTPVGALDTGERDELLI